MMNLLLLCEQIAENIARSSQYVQLCVVQVVSRIVVMVEFASLPIEAILCLPEVTVLLADT